MKFSPNEIQSLLPVFFDTAYPKGKDKGRGAAILAVCLFILWLEKEVKKITDGARDYWTLEAMKKYGGSFVQALAEVARRADRQNLEKIKTTWVEYWIEYEKKGRELEGKNCNWIKRFENNESNNSKRGRVRNK